MLDVRFPETLLSIDLTTVLLIMFILLRETNNFNRNVVLNYSTVPKNPKYQLRCCKKHGRVSKIQKKQICRSFGWSQLPSAQTPEDFFLCIVGTLPCFLHHVSWFVWLFLYSSIVLHFLSQLLILLSKTRISWLADDYIYFWSQRKQIT